MSLDTAVIDRPTVDERPPLSPTVFGSRSPNSSVKSPVISYRFTMATTAPWNGWSGLNPPTVLGLPGRTA